MDAFYSVVDLISGWISQPPTWLFVLMPLFWDALRRIWPTLQPASFFHDVGRFLSKIGILMQKLGELLDNIAPQNLKKPSEPKGLE